MLGSTARQTQDLREDCWTKEQVGHGMTSLAHPAIALDHADAPTAMAPAPTLATSTATLEQAPAVTAPTVIVAVAAPCHPWPAPAAAPDPQLWGELLVGLSGPVEGCGPPWTPRSSGARSLSRASSRASSLAMAAAAAAADASHVDRPPASTVASSPAPSAFGLEAILIAAESASEVRFEVKAQAHAEAGPLHRPAGAHAAPETPPASARRGLRPQGGARSRTSSVGSGAQDGARQLSTAQAPFQSNFAHLGASTAPPAWPPPAFTRPQSSSGASSYVDPVPGPQAADNTSAHSRMGQAPGFLANLSEAVAPATRPELLPGKSAGPRPEICGRAQATGVPVAEGAFAFGRSTGPSSFSDGIGGESGFSSNEELDLP